MMIALHAAMSAALWVLLWGLGTKAIDALMLTMLYMILAVTAHIVLPYLPGRRSSDEAQPDAAPFT